MEVATCHGDTLTTKDRIDAAAALLTIAEQELQLALSQLKIEDRGDKQMVSLVVEAAFAKLNAARRALDEARTSPT